MFVAVSKSRGIEYVFIRDYRTDPDGRRRQVTVKSLGRKDALMAQDPDFLTKLRNRYREESEAERKRDMRAAAERFINEFDLNNAEVISEKPAPEEEDALKSVSLPLMSYALQLLRPVWRDWLKLPARIGYIQERYSKMQEPVSEIAFYLTALKLISPCSQLGAYQRQTGFLFNPVEDIHPRSYYRTLEFLCAEKDRIMKAVSRSVEECVGRDYSMVYYDCTNCYFETDLDDRQKVFQSLISSTRDVLTKEGRTCSEIENHLRSPEFASDMFKQLSSDENPELYFRMRGLSREHRYDLPLISIALVMDSRGIPVDFEVFEGNISEYKTLPEAVESLKKKYPIKEATVFADRGLNSASNLYMLESSGLGYIVAQKITGLSESLGEQMLDAAGYRLRAGGREIQSFDEVPADDIAYKPGTMTKKVRVPDPENEGGFTVKEMECTVIFTYSPTRRQRDMAQLNYDVVRAQDAVSRHKDMRPCGAGWRGLVSVKADDGSTGGAAQKAEAAAPEDVEEKKQCRKGGKGRNAASNKSRTTIYRADAIKQNVIDNRAGLAGFCAIVYKKPAAAKKEMAPEEICSSHHELSQIEECFRIMKSDFMLRPMYVRREETVTGHILVCVLALIMLRLLEIKLRENGYQPKRSQLLQALGSAMLTVMPNARGGFTFINVGQTTGIYNRDDYKSFDPGIVTERWQAACDGLKPIDMLTHTVGLKPLQAFNSLRDLNVKLGMNANIEQAIGRMLYAQLTGAGSKESAA